MNDPAVVNATERIISFSSILEGSLGQQEIDAAKAWLHEGAPIYNPDESIKKHKLIALEPVPRCYDTRIFEVPTDSDAEDVQKEDTVKKQSQRAVSNSKTTTQKEKNKSNKSSDHKAPKNTNDYSRDAFVPYGVPTSIQTFKRMPAGWSSDAGIPPIPGAYLSPEGILCTSGPMIAAVSEVQGQSAGTSMQHLLSWLKLLGTLRRDDIPDLLLTENMRKVVALQRARIVMYHEEKRIYDKKRTGLRTERRTMPRIDNHGTPQSGVVSKRKRVTFVEKT